MPIALRCGGGLPQAGLCVAGVGNRAWRGVILPAVEGRVAAQDPGPTRAAWLAGYSVGRLAGRLPRWLVE